MEFWEFCCFVQLLLTHFVFFSRFAGGYEQSETEKSTEKRLSEVPEELLFKVIIVGDAGTGKTSIVKRYVHNVFSLDYKSTIGVDFAMKVIHWDTNTIVRLQLWDIAGR
eukprot:TRINITY_DN2576_c0_g2_i1.p2 TRINITY_DN2576_c0_g2~~TRINITY_DN2576_c0_g2_i1.p2  ORF type:complete len:109 (+),score=26.96 TRINITY_DN2576_c0_g2_i1:163-489(+)